MKFFVIYDSFYHDILGMASNTMNAAIIKAFERIELFGYEVLRITYGSEYTTINCKYVDPDGKTNDGKLIITVVETEIE